MGFDVVYLPPIHPIGTVHRKGPQQLRLPGGNPVRARRRRLAVGHRLGRGRPRRDRPRAGHDRRLRRLRRRAPSDLGMEVALDFALQCAPDHPWVAAHPEWFTVRPDGTIAYAENPPKKYQDIYPVNFDNDPAGIYAESLRVRAALGRARRADLPGGQPAHQAAELLALADLAGQGQAPGRAVPRRGVHPPGAAVRAGPAGLHAELHATSPGARARRSSPSSPSCTPSAPTSAGRTCSSTPRTSCTSRCRPAGPAMFAIRATLAATMSPDLGRLLRLRAVRGRAGQARAARSTCNSEKYELRPRDFAAALAEGRSLEPYITRLNEIRRAHPALQQLRDIHFHHGRQRPGHRLLEDGPGNRRHGAGGVHAGPVRTRRRPTSPWTCRRWAPTGATPSRCTTRSAGTTFHWGQFTFVRLEPWRAVAHVLSVTRLLAVTVAPLADPRGATDVLRATSGGPALPAMRARAPPHPSSRTAEMTGATNVTSAAHAGRAGRHGRRQSRRVLVRGLRPRPHAGRGPRLVQAGGVLRGARPRVRRLEPRRHRRPARADREARLHPVAGRRLPLAAAVLRLAAARRRLRHPRLPRGAARVRHRRRLRGAARRGAQARHPGHHRPRHEPHLGHPPWFEESRRNPDGPYGDFYVWSDDDTRYPDARIIFVDTEHVELDLRPGARPVLLAPVLLPPARPQLRQPGRRRTP